MCLACIVDNVSYGPFYWAFLSHPFLGPFHFTCVIFGPLLGLFYFTFLAQLSPTRWEVIFSRFFSIPSSYIYSPLSGLIAFFDCFFLVDHFSALLSLYCCRSPFSPLCHSFSLFCVCLVGFSPSPFSSIIQVIVLPFPFILFIFSYIVLYIISFCPITSLFSYVSVRAAYYVLFL